MLRLGRPFSVIQPVRLAPAEAHKRQLKQCFYPVTCHNIDYSRDGVMMLRQLTDVFSRRISPRMRHIGKITTSHRHIEGRKWAYPTPRSPVILNAFGLDRSVRTAKSITCLG